MFDLIRRQYSTLALLRRHFYALCRCWYPQSAVLSRFALKYILAMFKTVAKPRVWRCRGAENTCSTRRLGSVKPPNSVKYMAFVLPKPVWKRLGGFQGALEGSKNQLVQALGPLGGSWGLFRDFWCLLGALLGAFWSRRGAGPVNYMVLAPGASETIGLAE